MTAPIWLALPPEVHSALLSAGPGAGAVLAAASQWRALSVHYGETAAELTALLAEAQTTSWQGTSATQYVAAHAPYLAWLDQAAFDSAAAAAQHETIAAAYTTSLAVMPTLAELAANQTSRAVLMATNFFGINTIPITVNEANYARMWVQAAETMAAYQAVAAAATAAIPVATPAPSILAPGGEFQTAAQDIPNWIAQLLKDIADFIADPYKYFLEFFERLGFSPAIAIALAGITLVLYDILWYPYYAAYGLLLAPLLSPALSALSALSALALLLNPPDFGWLPAPAAPTVGQHRADISPSVGLAPASPSSAGPQASNPTPNTAPSTAASPAPSTPAIPYAIPGLAPPGEGFGPKSGVTTSDTLTEAAAAAAAARSAAAARHRARRTSRSKADARSYRHEFLSETVDAPGDGAHDPPGTPTSAGAHGAGTIGFTGATSIPTNTAARGMAEMPSTQGRAHIPLLPSTWTTTAEETPKQG